MSMSTHLYVKHPRTTQLNVVLYKSHIIIIIIIILVCELQLQNAEQDNCAVTQLHLDVEHG